MKARMEFGKSLAFFTENRHVCILPNNLKKEVLAAEYIQLSSKLEAFQERHKDKSKSNQPYLKMTAHQN